MIAVMRARRKGMALVPYRDRTKQIAKGDIVLICVAQNERPRMAAFLQYYRQIGVKHFLFVDNRSNDGMADYLAEQPDVSVWTCKGSYKNAHFGLDWSNALARRYCVGHWVLTVDADEYFVYPYCDLRPLPAMTDWLDSLELRSFGAILLDMYSDQTVTETICEEGQDPLDVAPWFDAGNYTLQLNPAMRNLWIQGGPRMRQFFSDAPIKAPALNKVPLVKWEKGFAYVSSTHMLLPRGLNIVYDTSGAERASGALLHFKFLNTISEKTADQNLRAQHYASGREYEAYQAGLELGPSLWTETSEKYINWRQLEILGLMSKGSWT